MTREDHTDHLIDEPLQLPKKSNHQAKVLRITELLAHPDPETTNLAIVRIDGYQLVVRKGQFKIGDLAVHIQPDSVVPQSLPFKFIWENYVELDGTVSERRRRITVRKFRKEWSEGLLLPLTDFPIHEMLFDRTGKQTHSHLPVEGEDISDRLGVTHYDPDAGGPSNTKGTNSNAPKRKFKYPRTIKGWFRYLWRRFVRRDRDASEGVPFTVPTYDVEAFKNYTQVLEPFESVVVTEKIHGSNARYLFLDGVMYAGSRNLWKAPDSSCIWRRALKENPWIEQWCRENEGYALYGEVTPTQPGFTYGSNLSGATADFFIFDILGPDRKWVDFDQYGPLGFNDVLGDCMVPILYYGPFVPDKVLAMVDGPSFVWGANHMREGIVIKTTKERTSRGLGRVQLKVVSNKFLEKDSK